MAALLKEESTITAKGQTTVPKAVRQALGVDYGGRLAFVVDEQRRVYVEKADEEASEFTLEEQVADCDLIIDALVGYGLQGPPSGMAAAVAEIAVQSRRPILSLDVPTGVNANTGEASTPAIHASTTLMLDLPKKGVVDADSKVHGLPNLFIAGSSVFPTYGSSNPTMNLLALTLRLADHLKAVMV